MAAPIVISVNPMNIPGLGMPLDIAQLDTSRLTYNSLLHVAEQTELQTKLQTEVQKKITSNLNSLIGIIDRHSMGDNFRLHSLHRHTLLPDHTIRLETDAGKTGYKWAKATPIKDVDQIKLHPTFFKFHDGAWVPFEFAEGPLPINVDVIPAGFFSEVAAYLVQNQLTDMIALELGHFTNCRRQEDSATAEIEVQWGEGGEPFTLSVSAKDLVDVDGKEHRLVPTGWNVTVSSGGPRDPDPAPPAGTYYNEAKKSDGSVTHKVHVRGGNRSSKDVTAEQVVQELVGMGIIRG